jgi:hypothetical protein
MRSLDKRLKRLEGSTRRSVQDLTDEELTRELAEGFAPILGRSIEDLTAEIPGWFGDGTAERLIQQIEAQVRDGAS